MPDTVESFGRWILSSKHAERSSMHCFNLRLRICWRTPWAVRFPFRQRVRVVLDAAGQVEVGKGFCALLRTVGNMSWGLSSRLQGHCVVSSSTRIRCCILSISTPTSTFPKFQTLYPKCHTPSTSPSFLSSQKFYLQGHANTIRRRRPRSRDDGRPPQKCLMLNTGEGVEVSEGFRCCAYNKLV